MSATAARTAPQALTTPFTAPSSCTGQFDTTSFITSFYWNAFETTTVTLLVSATSDASCRPTAVDQNDPFEFSPAVCPSGWTAYALGPTTPVAASTTVTTAFCCSSGFSFSSIAGLSVGPVSSEACFQDIAGEAPTTSTPVPPSSTPSSTGRPLFPNGVRVHDVWHISWETSDIATLSPPPPQIPCTAWALDSWVPGATVDSGSEWSGCNDGASHMGRLETGAFWFVAVGLPILVFLLIVVCVTWCCCRRQKKRRVRVEAGAYSTSPLPGTRNK